MSRVFLYFFDFSLDNAGILWYNIIRAENAPVAQLVEHLTFNQVVRSSTLRRSTRKKPFVIRVAFFNDICLRQMMSASPNDDAPL